MGDDYKDALLTLHKALGELKSLTRACEENISAINIILEKQGLKDWAAGETVNKTYCKNSHDVLVCDVGSRIKKLEETVLQRIDVYEKNTSTKLHWTWIIGTFVMGGFGTYMLFLVDRLH